MRTVLKHPDIHMYNMSDEKRSENSQVSTLFSRFLILTIVSQVA
jgi:hypothetical protein